MNVNNSQFLSIEQLQDQYLNKQQKTGVNAKVPQGKSFEEILFQHQLKESQGSAQIKFSKHASNRLSDRNIELTTEQMERLGDGMKKAGEKGIKESLVLVDELAFIVNTKNNMVITAMDQTETKDNIFTNIDGAVII
ncbi:MAG: flagellar protein [Lachnospiraceae bacterium]|nr:flagellar protein [Lachnospiraceae bacterium]